MDPGTVIGALSTCGATADCIQCQGNNWGVDQGVVPLFVASDQDTPVGDILSGGDVIPAVAMVCNNCGYIRLHAARVLGLLR